ncbi:glr3832 [Gloeobacter violaceus PCC 7421]|uniref:Glr3832 protein n=1 Tax=Gloeobacter violaceus (strain ATCC 29082 / PCC 7421) TaxID=251221 RepID=Q7NEP6_GLOVI|nr:glr3832 [Gloeobacter violaceus PCC 7421]
MPLLWILLLLSWTVPVAATPLAERVRAFPAVGEALNLAAARGELVYPDWFAGTWRVRTTLADLAAPQGETVINRQAFAASQTLKGKPVDFQARFVRNRRQQVVADLAFNNRSIAEAYFGRANVLGVEVRPDEPNRQVIALKGDRRGELVTLRRHSEKPAANRFEVAEFYQQTFTGSRVPNLRAIETVTLYTRQGAGITAEQITAVYLDPRDPAYFDAKGRAVTVYRYRLEFNRSIP